MAYNTQNPSPDNWRDTLNRIHEEALHLAEEARRTSHERSQVSQYGNLHDTALVFRGEVDHCPDRPLKTRLRRRVESCLTNPEDWDSIDFSEVLHYLETQDVRLMQHYLRGTRPLNMNFERPLDTTSPEYDLVLWKLQHQDGVTNRLDCTRSLPVAIWFACHPAFNKDGEELDGAVIALDLRAEVLRERPSRYSQDLDDPRYHAQHGVLISLHDGILPRSQTARTWQIPVEHKKDLIYYLELMHGITDESMRPDVRAAVEAQESRLHHSLTDEFLQDIMQEFRGRRLGG